MEIASQFVLRIDRKVRAEELFAGNQQARFLRDHTRYMIRKAAVRIRNIRSAFDHNDLGLFIQPTQARRTRRSARYSTDDDDFHDLSPFLDAFL